MFVCMYVCVISCKPLNGHVQQAVFKMDNHQGPCCIAQYLCSISCGGLVGRGVLGRMDTCVSMSKSLCSTETITSLLIGCSVQFSSITWSCPTLWPHELQHTRPPCPSPTPGVYSNSCPSSQWCDPAISSSAVPFSSCPQSLPASGSFPMSQLFM